MKKLSLFLSLILSIFVIGSIQTTAANAASKEVSVSHSMATKQSGKKDGQAKITGKLKFTKNSVRTSSTSLYDLCPADGYGATVVYTIKQSNGKSVTKTFYTTNNCTKTAGFTDGKSYGFTHNTGKAKVRVTSVTAKLCEVNRDAKPQKSKDCVTKVYTNTAK